MILGVPGSEYRLAITALMLSNKVLDDNSESQTFPRASPCDDPTTGTVR